MENLQFVMADFIAKKQPKNITSVLKARLKKSLYNNKDIQAELLQTDYNETFNINRAVVNARAKMQAMDCVKNNKLHNYYSNGLIDYPMYRALQRVYSFKLCDSDSVDNIYFKSRYGLVKHLWDVFRQDYKYSKFTLSYKTLRAIHRAIVNKVYTILENYTEDTKRVYWSKNNMVYAY